MFVSHGNIFCNGNKNATSLYETAFLIGVSIFSVNRKRIVLLTLFCLLKNRNNGNFTVPIHKIPVIALLIIRIINFRFRFKRGVVSLSERRLWYTRKQINNTPHLYSTEQSTSRTNTSDECYCYPCLLKTTTFSLKDKS